MFLIPAFFELEDNSSTQKLDGSKISVTVDL